MSGPVNFDKDITFFTQEDSSVQDLKGSRKGTICVEASSSKGFFNGIFHYINSRSIIRGACSCWDPTRLLTGKLAKLAEIEDTPVELKTTDGARLAGSDLYHDVFAQKVKENGGVPSKHQTNSYTHEILTFFSGMDVLPYDHAGKGLSEGSNSESGLLEAICLSGLSLKQVGYDESRIVLKGQCAGGIPTSAAPSFFPRSNAWIDQAPNSFSRVSVEIFKKMINIDWWIDSKLIEKVNRALKKQGLMHFNLGAV